MDHLNVVNFAQTVDALGSRTMRGFEHLTPAVYLQAHECEGFIASAEPLDDQDGLSFFERDWGKWGNFTVPDYYVGGFSSGIVFEASALSVWKDLDSLRTFVYKGLHAKVMGKKDRWFAPMPFPGYALWWSPSLPTWREGANKLELINKIGPSAEAFTFSSLFDEKACPTQLQTEQPNFVGAS